MGLYKKLQKLDFGWYLTVISVLGFVPILVSAIFPETVGGIVDASITGLLFILMGIALSVSGGIKFFFRYFKDGLTPSEINRLVTIIVGIAAIITGFIISPLFGVETDIINPWKAIIAGIAIFTIIAERVGDTQGKKK